MQTLRVFVVAFLWTRSSAIFIPDGDISPFLSDGDGSDLNVAPYPEIGDIQLAMVNPDIPVQDEPFSVAPDQDTLPPLAPNDLFSTTLAPDELFSMTPAPDELLSTTPDLVALDPSGGLWDSSLPVPEFNTRDYCMGKDIDGFRIACDTLRCDFPDELRCCPEYNGRHETCISYQEGIPICQASKTLWCCRSNYEELEECYKGTLHLPSGWREPTSIGPLDATLNFLRTPVILPCAKTIVSSGTEKCPEYDTRCCVFENYGTQ